MAFLLGTDQAALPVTSLGINDSATRGNEGKATRWPQIRLISTVGVVFAGQSCGKEAAMRQLTRVVAGLAIAAWSFGTHPISVQAQSPPPPSLPQSSSDIAEQKLDKG